MYTEYFQLQEAPFSIAPNPRFLYMSTRHQEALAHLLYGIDNGGGFVALTGEIGTGKTTLCRSLLESLPDHVEIALILNPKLNSLELLASICDELGIAYPEGDITLKTLIDSLNNHLIDSHAQGKRTVLVIDEAQNLSLEVLEQIRLLTNLETSEIKLLQIILIGQPELQQLLNDKNLRQLNQRISARYHLLALSPAETRKYIQHRLVISKGDPKLFNAAAINRVYRYSKGIPRLINIICDRALLGAYASNKKTITPSIINKAARESLYSPASKSNTPRIFVLVCLVASITLALYFLANPTDILDKVERTVQSAVDTTPHQNPVNPKAIAPAPSKATDKTIVQPAPDKKAFAKAILPPNVNTVKPSTSRSPNLSRIINNQELNLSNALRQLLKAWGKPAAQNALVNCPYLETVGLRCLTGSSTWQKVKAFNRPVILELSLIGGDIRHVLVSKSRNKSLVVSIDGKPVRFTADELLTTWQGRYLIAWQPSFSRPEYLYPNSSSVQINQLRKLLKQADGKTSISEEPNIYDSQLRDRVLNFQQKNYLAPDGVVGPKTMIHLQNSSNTTGFPTLY